MTDLMPKSESPNSVADIVEIVKRSAADRGRIRCCRRGTDHSDSQNFSAVVLDRMNAVIDYPALDMTVTVQAGMPWGELSEILATEQQQLPVDVADLSASVGSVVAADIAGPRQYGYGTLRDYVIGIEAVDGQGRVFHAGGRVVKNVAGYDLCRLLVGSRGLLGIISQVTFKLKPLAETSAVFAIGFSDVTSVEAALSRLNSSAATPIVLDLATSASGSGQPFVLTLAVEGSQKSCDWQREVIQQECNSGKLITPVEAQQTTLFDYCRSFDFVRRHSCLRCRPSQIASIAAELAESGYSSIGHAGNGILYVRDDVADGNVRRVCDDVARSTGSLVSEWTIDHPAASTNPLTLKARATFDPSGIFIV